MRAQKPDYKLHSRQVDPGSSTANTDAPSYHPSLPTSPMFLSVFLTPPRASLRTAYSSRRAAAASGFPTSSDTLRAMMRCGLLVRRSPSRSSADSGAGTTAPSAHRMAGDAPRPMPAPLPTMGDRRKPRGGVVYCLTRDRFIGGGGAVNLSFANAAGRVEYDRTGRNGCAAPLSAAPFVVVGFVGAKTPVEVYGVRGVVGE